MKTVFFQCCLVLLLLLPDSGTLQAAEGERYPETKTKLLQAADLQGWDDAKLRYAINEMYARHGADFKDKKIKEWFKRFAWYRPKAGQTYDTVELEFTDIEKQNVKLLGEARSGSVKEPAASGPTAPVTPAGASGPKIATVSMVNQVEDKFYGDIEVRFADGHTEIWSDAGRCNQPDLADNGIVGWVFGNEVNATGRRIGKDVVRLRLSNGGKAEFLPNPAGGPFIEKWVFADRDTAIVIKSRGNHGPASFIKYDIASRKVLGHQDGYVPENKMPPWAQPYAD